MHGFLSANMIWLSPFRKRKKVPRRLTKWLIAGTDLASQYNDYRTILKNVPHIIGVTCPPFWEGALCAVLTSPAGSYACNHDIGQACWVSVKRSNAGCYAHSIVTDYFVSRQKHRYHFCLRKGFSLLSQSPAQKRWSLSAQF